MALWRVLRVILVVCLLFGGACSSSPTGPAKPRRKGPKVNIPHFIKDTAAYKGKTITLGLQIDEASMKSQGQSLADFTGKDVKFTAIAPNGQHLNLVITIPEGL